MAATTLSLPPSRPRLRPLVMVGMALCIVAAVAVVRIGRDPTTPGDTFRALATSDFGERLPLEIALEESGATPGEGELVGRVSYSALRETPAAEGGLVVLTYEVYRSPEAARNAYDSQVASARRASKTTDRGYRFFQASDVTRPHTCVDEGQEYCLTVESHVKIEALSRIHMFEPDRPSHVVDLLGPALRHLEQSSQS